VLKLQKHDGVTSKSLEGQLFGQVQQGDIAHAALYMASDESRSTTGQILAVDGIEGGWQLSDSILFSRELKALGVDLIHCSPVAFRRLPRRGKVRRLSSAGLGSRFPFRRPLKQEARIGTIAVGLIIDPEQAEAILVEDMADLIAIGREPLHNPNWALHARLALQADPDYLARPEQYGWWLNRRPKAFQE